MIGRVAKGLSLWALLIAACSGDTGPEDEVVCSIPPAAIIDGGVSRDGIPALTDPALLTVDGATYLQSDDRVLGYVADGVARAYPLPILWWHEIINDTVAGQDIVVTYCPLTGSGIAFDPAPTGERFNFGVSGLLFLNNLIMFDRTTGTLWPQMLLSAGCGDLLDTDLTLLPLVETTWEKWAELHPNTTVVSDATGFSRDYSLYPYGTYRELNTGPFFPQAIDTRRPPKELVLGVLHGDEAVAYPFLELTSADGTITAVNDGTVGGAIAVFFDPSSQTAFAYERELAGETLTLGVSADGAIVDAQTGSEWNLLGEATSGVKAGAKLKPVSRAFVVFWFAWAAFNSNTRIWTE